MKKHKHWIKKQRFWISILKYLQKLKQTNDVQITIQCMENRNDHQTETINKEIGDE